MTRRRTPRAEILSQVASARAREARDRAAGRRAVAVRYDRRSRRVMMELTTGYVFGFPTDSIPALVNATHEQRASVELSPGGAGLHWEELDVDLSVPGLLLASVSRAQKLREFARAAGQSRSAAKAAAARANGAKGGRPRKGRAQ